MKKKILSLFILVTILAASASSQTIKENIDKAHADQDAKNKSAKADVIIMPKTIYDSAVNKTLPSKGNIETKVKVKSKKQKRKYKTKTSS